MTDDRMRPEWADDPPEPPVEAMWGVIRENLPHPEPGEDDPVGSPLASRARLAPSARTWIPLLVAAGLVGLMVGRWTAPVPTVDPPAPSSVALDVGDPGVSSAGETPPAAPSPSGGPAPSSGAVPADAIPPATGSSPWVGAAEPAGEAPSTVETPPTGATPPATDVLPPLDRPRLVLEPEGSPSEPTPFRFAATRHILEVGPLLTRLAGGSDPSTGSVPVEVRDWADQLLHETRLLLDSPEFIDPDLRRLLVDLELILTQVVTLPTTRSEAVKLELELIAEGMSERRILPRIHTVALAGEVR